MFLDTVTQSAANDLHQLKSNFIVIGVLLKCLSNFTKTCLYKYEVAF